MAETVRLLILTVRILSTCMMQGVGEAMAVKVAGVLLQVGDPRAGVLQAEAIRGRRLLAFHKVNSNHCLSFGAHGGQALVMVPRLAASHAALARASYSACAF